MIIYWNTDVRMHTHSQNVPAYFINEATTFMNLVTKS